MDKATHVFQTTTTTYITGEIVAKNVSYEDFLRGYDGQHVEWVDGVVIKMSPVDERHDALSQFVENLFQAYLELTGGGRVLQDPMVMRLGPDLPARQPDLQVLLPENLDRLGQNAVEGPADLVIEIISPESARRDQFEKFVEYERAGVREYWILNPHNHSAQFWILTPDLIYEARQPDAENVYRSSMLDRLSVSVDVFWREPLPGYVETLRLVEAMLSQD